MILNKVSNLPYIGSTSLNIEARWSAHREALRSGTHNHKMQKAWDETSESDWEWSVIEENIPLHCQFLSEQYWLDTYQSYRDGYGYNVGKKAGSYRYIYMDKIEDSYAHMQDELLNILDELKQGVPYRKLAKKYNVSMGYLTNLKRRFAPELLDIDKTKKEEREQRIKEFTKRVISKTLKQNQTIDGLVDGKTYREISKDVGVSLGYIGLVKKRFCPLENVEH